MLQAPVFLLFLDCLSQLLRWYPSEFQFSEVFLICLWDLALSGLTTTFSSNSLYETVIKRFRHGENIEDENEDKSKLRNNHELCQTVFTMAKFLERFNAQPILNEVSSAWCLGDFFRPDVLNLFHNRQFLASRMVRIYLFIKQKILIIVKHGAFS